MKTVGRPYVLAFGDSLTAGYGLPPSAALAARLQALLRRTLADATVQNGGVSGDTTQSALSRLPRLLAALPARPDLVIVELGANDLLRGMPPARTAANLDAILLELGRCALPVMLTAFEPPGLVAAHYGDVYGDAAARHGAHIVPFFPPGVLCHPELVLPDGIHPNARAIELIAAALLPAIMRVLSGDEVATA